MELPLTETERQQRSRFGGKYRQISFIHVSLRCQKTYTSVLIYTHPFIFPSCHQKKKRDDFSLLLGSHVYILQPIQFHSLRGELKVNRIPEQHVDSLQVKCHPRPKQRGGALFPPQKSQLAAMDPLFYICLIPSTGLFVSSGCTEYRPDVGHHESLSEITFINFRSQLESEDV